MLVRPYRRPPLDASGTGPTTSAAYVAWHQQCGLAPPTTDAPIALPVPAGTVIALAPYVWHCSSANKTSSLRRAFMPQYSAGPVLVPSTAAPLALAVPLSPKGTIAGQRRRGREWPDCLRRHGITSIVREIANEPA